MNDISAMDAHPLDAYDGARTAPVAQLDRVLPSEGGGRGFESRLVRHILLIYKGFKKSEKSNCFNPSRISKSIQPYFKHSMSTA